LGRGEDDLTRGLLSRVNEKKTKGTRELHVDKREGGMVPGEGKKKIKKKPFRSIWRGGAEA